MVRWPTPVKATKGHGDRELEIMIVQYFFLVVLGGFVLSGCASQKESVTTTNTTEKRVYTQDEVQKTGETQTGPALEKIDPSVQTPGRR